MFALRRYLGALAVAIAAYGAYALLAAPWLEPRALGRGAASGSPPVTVPLDQSFRELFQPPAWELDNPKIVETAQCTLLMKDYQPLPDGRMEINPCTLVFYAASSPVASQKQAGSVPPRRPIVLRAPQGAVLQFDRPIDVGRATVGRLMEGTLRGPIRIFSPPSRPGANDALELTTRNVKIDREKVYTPSTVDFRYGGSFGRGHDLTITLLPEDKQKGSRSPSMGGVSVLQLARVERLHLEGAASGILPNSRAAGSSGAGGGSPAKVDNAQDLPLEVRCAGPMVVDFDQNLAALDEKVEISRVYPQGPPDRLTCDRLIFHLADRKSARSDSKDASQSGSLPTSAGADAQWSAEQLAEQVERVIAIGSPVVLDAPQSSTFAKAERMEYLTTNRRIALVSGRSAPQVTLRHLDSEFEAREIEYELAEPGRLGRLWAAGPGRLKFVPGPGPADQIVEASWQKELTIAPHDKNKVVSLKGRPSVQLGANGSFSTGELQDGSRLLPGEIHLWVLEVPRANSAAVPSPVPADRAGPQEANGDQPAPRYVILPDRMLATGQVDVDAPQLAGHTRELQAWFIHQQPPSPTPARASGAAFEPAPQRPQQKTDDLRTRLQKLDVTGNLIQLKVLRHGNDSAVEDLAITGNVKVKELVAAGPTAQGPLELSGDLVTLRQGTSENARLDIRGKPAQGNQPAENATVSARGLSLSGATIHLRRSDNRLWIPGPGEAVLPMPQEALERPLVPPPVGRQEAAGRLPTTAAPTRPLKVTWRDAFEFDGEKGVFSGAIEARGQAEFAAGEELTVTLNQRIDFAAPRQDAPVEVARLHFSGGKGDVTMQRVLYDEQGNTSAVDNARVRNLQIDRTTGKIFAAGPGEVWTVRRDLKALPGGSLAPNGNGPAARLAYVCVTFQGQIVGDINRREITFQRQVDTIYGQVGGWNERVAASRVEDLGDSGVHVQSDLLTVTEMSLSPQQKWVEIDASGNTLAEGIKFVARAARISYTTDKDQLIIAGDGHVPAEFWHRAGPGKPSSYSEARRFIFNRRNDSFQQDDARTIDLNGLPLGGKPPPKLR